MPSLSVTFTGDTSGLAAAYGRAEAMAASSARRQAALLNRAVTAPNNPMSSMWRGSQGRSASEDYAKWWNETLMAADLRAASRSNTARSLWRKRGQERAEAELAGEVEAASRSNMARALWRQRSEARAAARAEMLADMTVMARTGGMGIMSESGHKYGGQGGVVSEIAVIGHELLQGRGTGRVLGSISILAQRLGWLGKLIKSTAAEEIAAAHAEANLAGAYARTWYAANKKAEATIAAGIASGLSKTQAEAAAAADIKQAEAAMVDATAQKAKAAATVESAEIAAAAATVTLGPIGWAVIGLIALTGAIIGAAIHFHRQAVAAKNLAQALDPLKQKYTELAEAQDKAAKAQQEHADRIKDILDAHRTESELIDRKIKLLRLEAEARGLNDQQTLAMEKAALEVEQKRLLVERDKAIAAENAASDAAIAGATTKDFTTGETINQKQAEKKAKTLGEILDAAQAAMAGKTISKVVSEYVPGSSFPSQRYINRKADETDQLNFKVGDKPFQMSVAEAAKNFNMASEQARQLATDQKALDDILKDASKTTEEKKAALLKVQGDLEGISDQQKYPKRGKVELDLSANQRIGAFAMPMQTTMVDLARQQVKQQQATNGFLQKMEANMRKNPTALIGAMMDAINAPFGGGR